MTTLMEKPPIHTNESSPSSSPQTSRRKKIKRSNPVSKRRQTSPVVVRKKTRQFEELSDNSSEDENIIYEETENNETLEQQINGTHSDNDLENISEGEKMARPTTLLLMDANTNLLTANDAENKRASYLAKRRNTEQITKTPEGCTCRAHRGSLGSCAYCKNAKRRHTIAPTVTRKKVMEKEAKLLVLEYLSSLPPEKLTARHKSSPESGSESMDEIIPPQRKVNLESDTVHVEEGSLKVESTSSTTIPSPNKPETGSIASLKNPRPGSKKGFKANTVTIGQHEREELMRQLREHENQYKPNGKLNRSASDASDRSYSNMRSKLIKMKLPVQQWLQSNVNYEISNFDRKSLNVSPRKSPRKSTHALTPRQPSPRQPSPKQPLSSRQASPRQPVAPGTPGRSPTKKLPLSLTIPRRSIQQITRSDSIMFTPETFAVNRLEEISEDIMEHYPYLLNDAIEKMLTPIMNQESLSYDIFSKVARTVFNIRVQHISSTVWSRVALVLYLVKETMVLGNLNDTQLEILVEHSTKFMTENVSETVEKEGGWEAIELDDWMFYSNVLARDEYNTSDEDCVDSNTLSRGRLSRQDRTDLSFSQNVKETLYEWTPYGMAALAVGLGLAYSYLKV